MAEARAECGADAEHEDQTKVRDGLERYEAKFQMLNIFKTPRTRFPRTTNLL